jgi:hypothetical protein
MSASDKTAEAEDSRLKLISLIVGVVIVLGIVGIVLFLRPGQNSGSGAATLQGAIRPGTAEWEQYKAKLVLDEPEADEAKRALGDIVMSVHSIVRNFTGKTINGLEVHAAVVDHQGKAVKERTVVVIPLKQAELGPNKTMMVQVMLEGMSETDDRANIRMEVTGFKFKE